MYEIVFFRDEKGREPMTEYLTMLKSKAASNKDARIKYRKITEYLEVLEKCGTRASEPYTKNIDSDIWELRPLDDRLLFAFWHDNHLVILHHFRKNTKKTPKREIDQAKRNLRSF